PADGQQRGPGARAGHGRRGARVARAGGRVRGAAPRLHDPALRRDQARRAGRGRAGRVHQRRGADRRRAGRGRGRGSGGAGSDARGAGRHGGTHRAGGGGHARGARAVTSPAARAASTAREWLACVACGATYDVDEVRYACACAGLLSVERPPGWAARLGPALFDARLASRADVDRSGVWRFREAVRDLPAEALATHPEGATRLYSRPALSDWAGIERLLFKHEGENPTGSFKDRGMAVGITQALRVGARAVACASTGNTSASLAAYAAQVGRPAFVFLPAGKV